MSINPSNAISERITGIKAFPNIARLGERDPKMADDITRAELVEARIKAVELDDRYGEPHTCIEGRLLGWTFRRAWYYWRANGPGLPLSVTMPLHEANSNSVRVDGHCGCPAPNEEWRRSDVVTSYHVDNPKGLMALADALRAHFVNGIAGTAAKVLHVLPAGTPLAKYEEIVNAAIAEALCR